MGVLTTSVAHGSKSSLHVYVPVCVCVCVVIGISVNLQASLCLKCILYSNSNPLNSKAADIITSICQHAFLTESWMEKIDATFMSVGKNVAAASC